MLFSVLVILHEFKKETDNYYLPRYLDNTFGLF